MIKSQYIYEKIFNLLLNKMNFGCGANPDHSGERNILKIIKNRPYRLHSIARHNASEIGKK